MLFSSRKPHLNKSLVKSLSLALVTTVSLLACSQAPNKEVNSNAPVDNTTQLDSSKHVTDSVPRETSATNQNGTSKYSDIPRIEQSITILALGDSLTEGLGLAEEDAYPAQLEKALKDAGYVNAKVVNSGLSGETSTGLVNRLDWALKTKPDITILTIGANDAMRGIDVATIEQNIRTAIKRLQSEGSVVVLGGMQIYDNLGNGYVKDFSAIYPRLAKEYNLAFIPFFLEGVGGVAELNQSDAIHPTAEGYSRIVNNNILPVLKPTLDAFVESKEAEPNETAQ